MRRRMCDDVDAAVNRREYVCSGIRVDEYRLVASMGCMNGCPYRCFRKRRTARRRGEQLDSIDAFIEKIRTTDAACSASCISGSGTFVLPIMSSTVCEGNAPGGISPSPVERIYGPGTSPDSTRYRSRRVFSHIDERSKTFVNPYRVKSESLSLQLGGRDALDVCPPAFEEVHVRIPKRGGNRTVRTVNHLGMWGQRYVGTCADGVNVLSLDEHDALANRLVVR